MWDKKSGFCHLICRFAQKKEGTIMPQDLQDFQADNCTNIIPQGDIVSEHRYVRTTLIEENLNDQLISWKKPDGSIFTLQTKALLGLPIWQISKDEGYQATSPQKVPWKPGQHLDIGTDLVVLPGSSNLGPSREIVKVYEEDIISQSEAVKKVMKRLTTEQQKILRHNREVTVEQKGSVPLTVRMITKGIGLKTKKEQQNTEFSDINNVVFRSGKTWSSLFRTLIDNEFNGDLPSAIEAFLADPRSGEYHDNCYTPNPTITDLPDNAFNIFFAKITAKPNWRDLVRIAPTPAQSQFLIGLVQVFKQTQKLTGFSRGRLIESVTLGPEETVSVEVFSFDRTTEEQEDTRSVETRSELERTSKQSQTVELSSDIESTIGASIGAELGASLPIEGVSVNASINNDVSAEIANRNQTTANLLGEASSRAAESYKATHQVKTLTRREFGTETRTTRTFKNPNLGRTLNLHHFEVMGHYVTETTVDEEAQFCLLVETPQIGPFDRDWIRAHHDFLDEVLRHDAYRKGLEAANLLAAEEWLNELAAAEKRAREEELQRMAEARAAAETAENYIQNKGIFATAKRLNSKLSLFLEIGSMENAINTIAKYVDPFDFDVTTSDIKKAEDLLSKWAWWTQLEAAYPGIHEAAQAFSKSYNRAKDNSHDPASADDMIAAVGEFAERFDDDWLTALKLFGAAYILAELMIFSALTNPVVYLYVMKLLYAPNNKGIPKIISTARAEFAEHKMLQKMETLPSPTPAADTLKPENMPPKPPRAYSEKELAQAHANMGRLVLHLQKNAAHYNNEYYKREDPALRMDRLSQLGVARFVGNRLLGFAGTRSIYPLNVQALESKTQVYLQTLIPDNSNFSIDEAKRTFTIPTGGFVTESIVGQCDALEPYLLKRREFDERRRELENKMFEVRISAAGGDQPNDEE